VDFMTEDEARKLAEDNLDNCIDSIDSTMLPDGIEHYSGKVRENYTSNDRKTRYLLTTDRVSVFDSVVGTVPFKGQVLDEITHWWFEKTKSLVHNHAHKRLPPSITVAEQCEPLKVEMIVRAYLTGTSSTSIWTAYQEGCREFCGNALPYGMEYNQRLPYAMVTPSTKAEHGGHDESLSPQQVLERKILPGDEQAQKAMMHMLTNQSLVLFGAGSAFLRHAGLILVDTKYEFGITRFGDVVAIDEMHTPDSSRFWEQRNYIEAMETGQDPKSISKQFVRDEILKQGYDIKKGGELPMLEDQGRIECAARYIMICQQITGERFEPDMRSVEERIYQPLAELGIMR
jgi:phosphoribosylaminoimidazole-succinocarboxamide synthase